MGLVNIRKFIESDIPYKVKWINDPQNNRYLHYDLPLKEDKTLEWFKTLKDRKNRADYTITYANEPVGLIGLLNINEETRDAEYYICLGEQYTKGKGVATKATNLLLKEAFVELSIKQIYLYTEVENYAAQKLFEKVGFSTDKLVNNELIFEGKHIDRYKYVIKSNEFIISSGE